MSNTNTGGPVFPTLPEHGFNYGMPGMTLRDYFAAKAMQGAVASCTQGQEIEPSICAPWCYAMADAMLKARNA